MRKLHFLPVGENAELIYWRKWGRGSFGMGFKGNILIMFIDVFLYQYTLAN